MRKNTENVPNSLMPKYGLMHSVLMADHIITDHIAESDFSLLRMSYTKTKQKGADNLYATTVARIQKIQSQLANSPRGIRLKDKVCIITGVGSIKGIGYAHLQ